MGLKLGFPRRLVRLKIMRRLFGAIQKLSRWHAVGFIAASFGLGQLINQHSHLDKFLVYQLLFIPAIVAALMEIKMFLVNIEQYRAMTASHPSRKTGDYVSRLIDSYWSVPGLVVVGPLYVYATVSLGYINMNLVGCYALVMILLVMLSAILGQTCYVYYLLLLRRISRAEKFKYDFYFPAKTEWVQHIAHIGNRLSNAFFILGFIYTIVFFLNMPDSYIAISLSPWSVQLATPNDAVFVASWVTIFIIIICAFPIYAWLKSKYLNEIIEKLKDASVSEIEKLMMKGSIKDKDDVDTELKFYQLMVNIRSSQSSPNDKYNLLPVAATLSSIAVHLIKILESLP